MTQKIKYKKVVLSESSADATKDLLKILKGIFEAQEKSKVVQPFGGTAVVQGLIDKLGHKQDQDGRATCRWK
jgi:hypothetical protein